MRGTGKPCRVLAIVVAVAALVGSAVSGHAAVTPEQLRRAMEATVFIKLTRMFRGQQIPGSGSGLFVSGNGHVLTNWHVVAPQVEIEYHGQPSEISTMIGDVTVVVGSGTAGEVSLHARVVVLDRKRDLALLRVVHKPAVWLRPPVRTEIAVTEVVWAIGFPYGELLAAENKNPEVTVTGGRVTAVRKDEKGRLDKVQVDAALNPGNSGGPVLDDSGELVGLSWAKVAGSSNTGFAIPPTKVATFLAENQFVVRLEPNAIYTREQPLKVTVSPGLLGLEGVSCRLLVSGSNIARTVVDLPRAGDGFGGKLAVPEPNGAVDPPSYELVARLVGQDGTTVAERVFALPLRSASAAPQLAPERDPNAVMRDRVLFANRSEVTPGLPGDAKQASTLAEIAKGVKVNRNVVIDNQGVKGGSFRPDPAKYAGLPTEQLRRIAIAFDEAEAALIEAHGATVRESPTPDYRYPNNPATADRKRQGEREQVQRAFGAALKEALNADLCRCEDRTWGVLTDRARSSDCQPPTYPHA